MKKHQFLMVSGDGNRVQRWEQTFPKSQIVNFGAVVKTKADTVWLKLNPFEMTLPQIEWVKKHYPMPFIVMSNIPNLREALEAINAGARGYINTHAGPNNLKQVVSVMDNHGIWVGEDLMQLLVAGVAEKTNSSKPAGAWQEKLSARELDVVNAVVKGLPNKLIARELNITERTVKAHLTAVFEKLQVADRLKLVLLVTHE